MLDWHVYFTNYTDAYIFMIWAHLFSLLCFVLLFCSDIGSYPVALDYSRTQSNPPASLSKVMELQL